MFKRRPSDDAPFRSYNKTDADLYNDGFQSGLKWPAHWNHVPGGPFVSTSTQYDHEDWVAYCKVTKRHHGEWMRGWYDGFAEAARRRPEIRQLQSKLLLNKLAA